MLIIQQDLQLNQTTPIRKYYELLNTNYTWLGDSATSRFYAVFGEIKYLKLFLIKLITARINSAHLYHNNNNNNVEQLALFIIMKIQ